MSASVHSGVTLTQHILRKQHEHPDARGQLSSLLTQIGVAAKLIGAQVRRAGLVEVWGSGAPAWVDGEIDGGRVRSGVLALGLWGCMDGGALTGCLGGRAGVEAHTGLDFVRGADSVGPWVAGGLRVDWRWSGGRWGPRAELIVPIGRLTLTVDEADVWSTPAIAGSVGIGGRW